MLKGNLTYRFMVATTVAIVLIFTVNFFWDYHEQKRQSFQELREKAQVITLQLIATREFIALHQDVINRDAHGDFEFKGMNPAAVGRGVGEIFGTWTDYSIKQTRLHTRNPNNKPDDYEVAALKNFQQNPQLEEIAGEDLVDGKRYFRYIIPLKVQESCLPCHGEPVGDIDIAGYPKEGYKLGELGGAISVMVPMDMFISNMQQNILRDFIFLIVLLVVTLLAIYLLLNSLVAAPLSDLKEAAVQMGDGNLDIDLSSINAQGEIKELAVQFQSMATQLRELYNNLEQKVEKRTEELQQANEVLRKKQQQLKEANLKLEKANQHKSIFLATMSHELRTPLTSIIAFAELLLENFPKEDKTNRQCLLEIKNSGENLLNLINNLLDMAKIEAGRHELHRETLDLVDVIDSVERMISPLAQKKNIDFRTLFLREIPLFKADPEKIRRAIENLAGNAVKFTPEGGTVEILVDYWPSSQEVVVKVKDTGIGINKEEQLMIFERFYQVDNSNSRRYQGTGLGLALAKELVEMHGGRIELESEPGKGSIFTIILPLDVNPLGG